MLDRDESYDIEHDESCVRYHARRRVAVSANAASKLAPACSC